MFFMILQNRMFGKNLVIELGPKTLSTNQISGFFKPQYLKTN